MDRLSIDGIQFHCATKPTQAVKELFGGLGFDDLVENGVKLEMSNAFNEVFKRYARLVNPKGGGEQVYAFEALRLLESKCWTWADLYASVPTSREEFLQEKSVPEKEVQNFTDREDRRLKKLSGELEVNQQKLCKV